MAHPIGVATADGSSTLVCFCQDSHHRGSTYDVGGDGEVSLRGPRFRNRRPRRGGVPIVLPLTGMLDPLSDDDRRAFEAVRRHLDEDQAETTRKAVTLWIR